jgi:hypothetical protein
MKEEGWFEAMQKGWGWLDGPNHCRIDPRRRIHRSIEVVVNTSAP